MSTVPDDEIRAILAKALAHDHPRRRTLHTREVDRVLLEEHKARGRASSKPAHAEGSKTEDGRTDWVIAARLISNQNQIEFRDQYAGTSWGSSFRDAIKDKMKRFRRTTRACVMEF